MMNSLEKLLVEELKEKFASNLIRWDSIATYVDFIEDSFPFVGSKISWSNVPNAISARASDDYASSGLQFFLDICDQRNLSGDCILVSDSTFDSALCMSIETLKECLKTILKYPHNLYVLSDDVDWCIVFEMHGYFDFGRTISSS